MINLAETTDPHLAQSPFGLIANWTFVEGKGEVVGDVMPGRNDFKIHNAAEWFKLDERRRALKLDGSSQYLATHKPVFIPGSSFTVGAWMRLDRKQPRDGEYFTAISQGSPAEGGFRLGASLKPNPYGGNGTSQLHWCFCVTAGEANGAENADWIEAVSDQPIDDTVIERWIFLVGTCDMERGIVELIVPTLGEKVGAQGAQIKKYAGPRSALEIGKHLELGRSSGFWPGGVAEVFAWSGVVPMKEIVTLHAGDPLLND